MSFASQVEAGSNWQDLLSAYEHLNLIGCYLSHALVDCWRRLVRDIMRRRCRRAGANYHGAQGPHLPELTPLFFYSRIEWSESGVRVKQEWSGSELRVECKLPLHSILE